jgi:hypothetical protein
MSRRTNEPSKAGCGCSESPKSACSQPIAVEVWHGRCWRPSTNGGAMRGSALQRSSVVRTSTPRVDINGVRSQSSSLKAARKEWYARPGTFWSAVSGCGTGRPTSSISAGPCSEHRCGALVTAESSVAGVGRPVPRGSLNEPLERSQ